MIKIASKKNCCGCAACSQRCPKHSITMIEDAEGFLYPHIDVNTCVDCGLCEKVCPAINRNMATPPVKVLAAKNRNIEKRELSSSGGLFIALAEQVIADGGVVFGVVFDDHWEAHHAVATNIEELQPMMRSKYVQSRTESTFAEAERYLKQGREVVYTGTSCQIAGLKRFLRKDYANLLAVDVLCHGVPSPRVWRQYLKEISEATSIADISFREKSRCGYNWQTYGFVIWSKSNNGGDGKMVLSSSRSYENVFMKGYFEGLYLRPSCHDCPANGGKSGADITIADYWGIEDILPGFFDNDGVGLAIVHTQKGNEAFSAVDFETKETTLEEATAKYPTYWHSAKQHRCRKKFFKLIDRNQRVDKAVEICLTKPLPIRIWKKIRKKLLS